MNRIVMNLGESKIDTSSPFLVWRKSDTEVSLNKPAPDEIDNLDKYNDISYYRHLTDKEVLYDIPETQNHGAVYTEICNNGLIACYDSTNNLLIVYDLLKTKNKSFADINPADIGVSANPTANILICKRDDKKNIYTEPRILIDGGKNNKWGLVDMSTDSFDSENGLFNLPAKITDFHFKAKPFILFKGLPDKTEVTVKANSVIATKLTDTLYYFYNYSGSTEFIINFTNNSDDFTDFIMEVS